MIRTLRALRSSPPRALEEAPHPLGTKEGGWKRGGMRRSCQNSLLTAKVTTLFPGPKRDNGRPEKVYIKADRAAYTPLPLDR